MHFAKQNHDSRSRTQPHQSATSNTETQVLVPLHALDQLLECIWEWALADYRATSANERTEHLFQYVVQLDAAIHDLTVDECWERIEGWWNGQHSE